MRKNSTLFVWAIFCRMTQADFLSSTAGSGKLEAIHEVGAVLGSCSEEQVMIGGAAKEGDTLKLGCVSNTGTMTVERAYYGTPNMGVRQGRFISADGGKYGTDVFWEPFPNVPKTRHPVPFWGKEDCATCNCTADTVVKHGIATALHLCNCSQFVTAEYLDELTAKSDNYGCSTPNDCNYYAAGSNPDPDPNPNRDLDSHRNPKVRAMQLQLWQL